jgi:hypothetical protein
LITVTIILLTEETSIGMKKTIAKEKNHPNQTSKETYHCVFLGFEYLLSNQLTKRPSMATPNTRRIIVLLSGDILEKEVVVTQDTK